MPGIMSEGSGSSRPGVQDREDTDAGAEVLGIGRDGQHGLGRSLEQDAVDCGLVLVGYIGDLSRQREHDVEVRHRQEFGLAIGQPLACSSALTLGAVSVAAANGRRPLPVVWANPVMGSWRGGARIFLWIVALSLSIT